MQWAYTYRWLSRGGRGLDRGGNPAFEIGHSVALCFTMCPFLITERGRPEIRCRRELSVDLIVEVATANAYQSV
jgi:hypothetical protein